MSDCGVVYVAFGKTAQREASESAKSLRHRTGDIGITIIDKLPGHIGTMGQMTDVQKSRWVKVNLDRLTQNEYTLYIDADTRVHQPVRVGFDVLADGWDLVLTPSEQQGVSILWHVGLKDKRHTLDALGYTPVQLQAGVFWFARNERTAALFEAWRAEWLKFHNQDQGALLRAMAQAPVKTWLLGRPFNGGAVIAHRYGALRGR